MKAAPLTIVSNQEPTPNAAATVVEMNAKITKTRERATHLICCRSIPVALRNLTKRDATDTAKMNGSTNVTLPRPLERKTVVPRNSTDRIM